MCIKYQLYGYLKIFHEFFFILENIITVILENITNDSFGNIDIKYFYFVPFYTIYWHFKKWDNLIYYILCNVASGNSIAIFESVLLILLRNSIPEILSDSNFVELFFIMYNYNVITLQVQLYRIWENFLVF